MRRYALSDEQWDRGRAAWSSRSCRGDGAGQPALRRRGGLEVSRRGAVARSARAADSPKRQLIAIGNKAEAEQVKRERAVRGETGPVTIVIPGVPRSKDDIEG